MLGEANDTIFLKLLGIGISCVLIFFRKILSLLSLDLPSYLETALGRNDKMGAVTNSQS
jgi:hypothetical protein